MFFERVRQDKLFIKSLQRWGQHEANSKGKWLNITRPHESCTEAPCEAKRQTEYLQVLRFSGFSLTHTCFVTSIRGHWPPRLSIILYLNQYGNGWCWNTQKWCSVVPNGWGVIHVMCGLDTVIAQQIQLLHSKNRVGRHKHPQQCWEMSQRVRGQPVLNRSGTRPHIESRVWHLFSSSKKMDRTC